MIPKKPEAPYVHKEYPKTVYPKGMTDKDEHGHPKHYVIVYNPRQEAAIMDGKTIEVKPPEEWEVEQAVDEDGEPDDTGAPEDVDEHTALLKEAAELGINVDGSISTRKLKKLISNARLTEKL